MWAARYPHDNKINSYPIEEDIPVGSLNPNLPNQIGWQYTSKGFVDGIKQRVDLNDFDEIMNNGIFDAIKDLLLDLFLK